MEFVCTICNDELINTLPSLSEPGVPLSTCKPCGHTFHSTCLLLHLERVVMCPVCQHLVTKENTINLFFKLGCPNNDGVCDEMPPSMSEKLRSLKAYIRSLEATGLLLQSLISNEEYFHEFHDLGQSRLSFKNICCLLSMCIDQADYFERKIEKIDRSKDTPGQASVESSITGQSNGISLPLATFVGEREFTNTKYIPKYFACVVCNRDLFHCLTEDPTGKSLCCCTDCGLVMNSHCLHLKQQTNCPECQRPIMNKLNLTFPVAPIRSFDLGIIPVSLKDKFILIRKYVKNLYCGFQESGKLPSLIFHPLPTYDKDGNISNAYSVEDRRKRLMEMMKKSGERQQFLSKRLNHLMEETIEHAKSVQQELAESEGAGKSERPLIEVHVETVSRGCCKKLSRITALCCSFILFLSYFFLKLFLKAFARALHNRSTEKDSLDKFNWTNIGRGREPYSRPFNLTTNKSFQEYMNPLHPRQYENSFNIFKRY